jgi:hypothetical protein
MVCKVLLIPVEVRAMVDKKRGGGGAVNSWTPDCGSVSR